MIMSTAIDNHAWNKTKSVGCDDGFAQIKLAWFVDGSPKRTIKTYSMLSRAQAGADQVSDLNGGGTISFSTDGGVFSVSPHLEGISTQFADYPVSALNRVLVHAALNKAGFAGMGIKLATGLPPGSFFDGGSVNTTLVSAKRSSLLKPVTAVGLGRPLASIRDHQVLPEAICAVIDWTLDEQGRQVNQMGGPVAVVDIGGRTSDIVVIMPDEDGMKVDHARSGTHIIGVLRMQQTLREMIRQAKGYSSEDMLSLDMDSALRLGYIRVYGENISVNDEITAAVSEVGGAIVQAMQSRLGRGLNLDHVLLVGGGAPLLSPLLKHYKNAVMIDNPQFANARGFLKSVEYLA